MAVVPTGPSEPSWCSIGGEDGSDGEGASTSSSFSGEEEGEEEGWDAGFDVKKEVRLEGERLCEEDLSFSEREKSLLRDMMRCALDIASYVKYLYESYCTYLEPSSHIFDRQEPKWLCLR